MQILMFTLEYAYYQHTRKQKLHLKWDYTLFNEAEVTNALTPQYFKCIIFFFTRLMF